METVNEEDVSGAEDLNNQKGRPPGQKAACVNSEEANGRPSEETTLKTTNQNPESVTAEVHSSGDGTHSPCERSAAQTECIEEPSVRYKFCTVSGFLGYLLQLLLYSPIKFYEKVQFSWGNVVWWLINITKIILVTFYTKNVGDKRAAFGMLVNQGYNSLQHLFLNNWDASWETVPYPPSHGPFAVYSVKELADGINHAVEQYYNAESNATGYFIRRRSNDSINLRVKYFNISFGTRNGLAIGEVAFRPDHGLTNTTENDTTVFTYNIEKEIRESKDLHFQLQNVLNVLIQMSLYSIRVFEHEQAECVDIYATITFDNTNHNGQVLVRLSTETQWIFCSTINFTVNEVERNPPSAILAAFSLCFLFVSVSIEITAIIVWIWGYCKYNNKPMLDKKSLQTDTVFGAISSMLTLVGDMLSFVSILFIQSKYKDDRKLYNLDASVVPLGIGLVLSYVAFLRFLKFSQSSSLLFKTVQKAFIPVVNFLVCVVILFIGFWIFAYIVFGLYHIKFTSPTSAADTLFSIINGDEIYATLANFDDQYAGNPILIYVSLHFCVYIYVMVFTVIVFNLLIALFNSAYEVIVKREHNKRGSLVNLQKCLLNARERKHTLQHLLRHLLDARKRQHTVQNLLRDLLSVTSRTEEDEQTDELLKNVLEFIKEKQLGQQSVEDLLQNFERDDNNGGSLVRLQKCLLDARERQHTVQHLLRHILSGTEGDQQRNELFLEFIKEKRLGEQSVEDLLQNLEKSLCEVAEPKRLADVIKEDKKERCMGEYGCCP